MTKASTEWAQKYRPRRFDQVLGQSRAVKTLAGYVQRSEPRSVVISGPTGAGKTTLAMIYAQACLCEAPDASGSPCGTCKVCESFEAGGCPDIELFTPLNHLIENVRDLVQDILSVEPWTARRRVILFDEASTMRAAAFGPLLPAIEARSDSTVFIFTLIDATDMPEPARDRLSAVVLDEASPLAALENLRIIAASETLESDEAALALIADNTDSFRRAVRDLQTVAEAGAVTAEAVHRLVLGPRYSWLVAYFEALGAGDREGQLAALKMGKLDAPTRTDLILRLINTLKRRFISPVAGENLRTTSVVSDENALEIITAFEGLAHASGATLAALWERLMVFWSYQPARITDEVLRAQVIRLHDLLHAGEGSGSNWGGWPAPPAPLGPPPPPAARRRQRLRSGRAAADAAEGYLSFAQAAAIYEAATFALQAYWAPFNLHVRLDWDAAPAREDRVLARAASEFAHHLQLRLKGLGYEDVGGFHRILLNERDHDGRLSTTLVGHVPDRHVVWAQNWLGKPQRGEAWGCTIRPRIDEAAARRADAATRHWRLVRELWRGLDPSLRVDDARALVDALGVAPNRRRPAGRVECRRFALSDGLGPSAQREAAAVLYPHFSAFDDRVWDWVGMGWEQDEYDRRVAAETHRAGRPIPTAPSGPGGRATAFGSREKSNKDQIDRSEQRRKPWSAWIGGEGIQVP